MSIRLGLGLDMLATNFGRPQVTTSFAGTNAAIIYPASCWQGVTQTVGGRSAQYVIMDGANCEVDGMGSAGTWNVYRVNGSGTFYLYVDDVLVDSSIANATWTTLSFSGKADTWHRIRIIFSGNAFQGVVDYSSTAITLTGSAPALRKPTAATGIDLSGTRYAAQPSQIQLDRSAQLGGGGWGGIYGAHMNRYRFVLVPDGSGLPMSVSAIMYPWEDGSHTYDAFMVTVDGYRDGTLNSDVVARYPQSINLPWKGAWVNLISGVTAGANRNIGVWLSLHPQASIHSDFITNNCTLGSQPAAVKLVYAFGDSILFAHYGSNGEVGWARKLCTDIDSPHGRGLINMGHQGDQITDLTNGMIDAGAAICTTTGDVFIIAYGTNDVINGVSAATFQSNLTTKLNYAITKTAKKLIVVQYPEAKTGISSNSTLLVTSRAAYKSAYQAAIAACTTPSQCIFVDTDGVMDLTQTPLDTTTTDLYPDGIHLNDPGHTKLAARIRASVP